MKCKAAIPIGVRLGFALDDDGPTTDWSDLVGHGQEQQAREDERTGTVVFPVQTVGPTAKELQHRRLVSEGGSRRVRSRNGSRPRPRGAGRPAVRGASRRSSARSGDSGDSGEEGPEGPDDAPPSRRRLCAHCGRPIPAERATQARYCSDTHADADRQRRKRARDRERDLRPRVPTAADERRMLTLEPGEHDRLRALVTCNGRHAVILAGRDDEPGPRCVKCGRLRTTGPGLPLAEAPA